MTHKELQFLNSYMYDIGYDMGEKSEVEKLKSDIDKIIPTIRKLLSLSDNEFKARIEKFDAIEFKDCQ